MEKDRLEELKEKIYEKIFEIQKLITDNVEPRGDKEEDCQRLYMLNRLSGFEYAVNGLEEEDLPPKKFIFVSISVIEAYDEDCAKTKFADESYSFAENADCIPVDSEDEVFSIVNNKGTYNNRLN